MTHQSKFVGGKRKTNDKIGRFDLNPTANIFLSCFHSNLHFFNLLKSFFFLHFKC